MGKKDTSAEITSLPGVGAATAKKLVDSKFTTVAKIAKASAKDLQNAGLSASVASKVLSAAKAASSVKSTAKKAGAATKSKVKNAGSKAASTAKKASSKAATGAKKATGSAKKATQKAVAKGQEVAEDVVEKTASAATSLKTKKDEGRKGNTISVPRSVKDMPWFKKR